MRKPLKLRAFQRQDVQRLKRAGLRALLASAPGTGKTIVAIRALVESEGAFPAMVACPASVIQNWGREFNTWGPRIKVIIVDDMDSKLPRLRNPNVVYILSWALLDARGPDLLRFKLKSIIGDEAHYIKNPITQRSKAMRKLTEQAAHVLLLTGTPIVNSRAELGVINSYIGENPLMIRRLLEDVAPDIPEKKRSYLNIQLRDRHQAAYDKIEEDFETWLRVEKEKLLGEGHAEMEVERTLAAEALAKIGYLRRMVGEYKVPAALDWISRAVRVGEPVVVFVEHQIVLKRLVNGLKKQRLRHLVVEGSTSPKKRQEAIDAFQDNQYPIFIGTKAAKEGITLTAARHLLFVERFFTSADEEQAEDRIRRIGQTHKTTIWFLHGIGTIDSRLDEIVRSKRLVVRAAIGSHEIAETDANNVEALLKAWGKHTYTDGRSSKLGHGEPLPALPKAREIHGIMFSGKRFTPARAKLWCLMNGYEPEKAKRIRGGFKLILHPAQIFLKGKFRMHKVTRDIRIITGVRMSRTNEARARRSMGL